MFDRLLFRTPLALVVLACAACSNTPTTKGWIDTLSPYKIDIVQGNVVTREQVAAIPPGTPRNQVLNILGTPLLSSVFHAQRWDYIFTLKRQGAPDQARRVTVFFKGEVVEKIEADALPSEAEFVASLKSNADTTKLPALVATPESLEKFPPPAVRPSPALPAPNATRPSYPPLEPAR